MNYQSVSASFNKGDAKDNNDNYYEFKTSFTNKDEKLNIRQIRPWQNIDFYYCFYINENIDVYNMKNTTTKRWYDLYLDANLKEEILYR